MNCSVDEWLGRGRSAARTADLLRLGHRRASGASRRVSERVKPTEDETAVGLWEANWRPDENGCWIALAALGTAIFDTRFRTCIASHSWHRTLPMFEIRRYDRGILRAASAVKCRFASIPFSSKLRDRIWVVQQEL